MPSEPIQHFGPAPSFPSSKPDQPVPAAKPKIQTGFTYWPLLGDLACRYIAYEFWRAGNLPNWVFWCVQLLVIPVIVFMVIGFRERRLVQAFGVKSSQEYEIKDAPGWIVFMLAVMVHNIVHAVTDVRIETSWRRLAIQILLGWWAFAYTLMVGVTSSSAERLDLSTEEYEEFDIFDENDRILTRLKAELDDFIRKVEAYTIESTLIGAITFAAFVTIIMADKGRFETAHHLLGTCVTAGRNSLSVSNWRSLWQLIHYPQEGTILAAVALTAVVCSLFFMGVMVARLRFSALVGQATFSTEMATNLNNKENDLAGQEPAREHAETRRTRLDWLHLHVDTYLNEAKVELAQLRPIIVYMTVFRTLGLLAFMLTLVLSALWFGPRTALCFSIIAAMTYCYPWIDAVRDKRLRKTDFSRLRNIIAGKLSAS